MMGMSEVVGNWSRAVRISIANPFALAVHFSVERPGSMFWLTLKRLVGS
jgi:hypothetical protein